MEYLVASSSARRFFSSFLVSVSFFTWSRVSSSSALIEEHNSLLVVISFNKTATEENSKRFCRVLLRENRVFQVLEGTSLSHGQKHYLVLMRSKWKRKISTAAHGTNHIPVVDTVSCQTVAKEIASGVPNRFHYSFFLYFHGGLQCVGHSFTYVAHL